MVFTLPPHRDFADASAKFLYGGEQDLDKTSKSRYTWAHSISTTDR